MPDQNKYYVTTPIYYVNDRPHIGHVYTTTVADMVARYHRLCGRDTFFLTGTDEHAGKVVDAAAERNLPTQDWADQNAKAFEETFARLGLTNDDFIRTSQTRHKDRVTQYIRELLETGDVYLGEYEGWYDSGQEEYVTENEARESDYKSKINGKALVKKTEKNYFFKLSKYANELLTLLERREVVNGQIFAVEPSARRNEVVARIKDGLNDVPVSRTGLDWGDWGIRVPDDNDHTIYVWIDALFNYLSAVDSDDRRKYWPADVHLIGKDILWFHAVIWPALLLALRKPLPKVVYAHSWWVKKVEDDGERDPNAPAAKMSKSLGNIVTLEELDSFVDDFTLDGLRYFLAADGPLRATDSEFSESRFIEVYNSQLANTLGNCLNRVCNMTNRYFDGRLPNANASVEANDVSADVAADCVKRYCDAFGEHHLGDATSAALDLVRAIDLYIENTQPFKLAKQEENLPQVGTILYNCAEAMRIAAVLLWPIIPTKSAEIWRRLGCNTYVDATTDKGTGSLDEWVRWGQLQPGTEILQGDPLFPRYQS